MSNNTIPSLAAVDLGRVVGGAGSSSPRVDFNAIKQQAQPYCPATVQRYSNINPATVTRPVAQRMANECLSEMGSFRAAFARPQVQHAIDQAFPANH